VTQQVERVINSKQAAEILGVHEVTVRVMAARGEIPGQKIGRGWKFRPSLLDQWLNAKMRENLK